MIVTLFYGFALLFQLVLVGLWVNAVSRQPKRLKARIGFAGGIFFLIFEICAFAFARTDAEVAPWILPLALIAPLGTCASAYRLYRRWDRKYWDSSSPEFLGWNQT
jgi:peptidoglycan/LPS O-acetylase OafA/YrhL